MKAMLSMLALLALAGAASAKYAPWYYQTLNKWRCFVPGCDQCEANNPYVCETCSAGYIPLKDNTCGCAPGFGSYVQPPMPGYPFYPPQSCPTWVKSPTGQTTKGVLRTTQANGKASKAVSLDAWYKTKPGFCARNYYPMKSCQGDLPGSSSSSSGYCRCFPCPTGTASAGGPINSMAAACTPGAQPVTRCKTPPPAIANAKPWNPTKCLNLKPGKACRTSCSTGYKPEPAGTNLTAACTAGGVWKTSGACASATTVLCKGTPDAGANAKPFTDCPGGSDGNVCTSTCVDGFVGAVTAACAAGSGKWSVTNTCTESRALCAPDPTQQADELRFWTANPPGCIDLWAGAKCDGTCNADGSAVTATCGADGQWIVDGTCPDAPACPGEPNQSTNGEAFTFNQDGSPFPCRDGKIDDVCQARCDPGFIGTSTAICLAGGKGWAVTETCVPGTDGSEDLFCAGEPPDATADNANPWPPCEGTQDRGMCQGSCADGFNAEGSYAVSYCYVDGTNTKSGVWENDVNCTAGK